MAFISVLIALELVEETFCWLEKRRKQIGYLQGRQFFKQTAITLTKPISLRQSNEQNLVHLVSWKHLLKRRHLIVIPHHLCVLELLSLLADEPVDLLQFLQFLLGQTEDIAGVHQFLLFPEFLNDVVVLLDVLKVLPSDGENLLEDLLGLGLLALPAGILNLLQHVPFLIIFEAVINNAPIDLLAV